MEAEILQLRKDLDRISKELAGARHSLERLKMDSIRRTGTAFTVALVIMALIGLASLRASAQAPSSNVEQIADLAKRVVALERGRNRITAPFYVVDGRGRVIMRIGEQEGRSKSRGFSLFDSSGVKPIVTITADGYGSLLLSDNDSQAQAELYSVAGEAALQLRTGDSDGTLLSNNMLWSGKGNITEGTGFGLERTDNGQQLSLVQGGIERVSLGMTSKGNVGLSFSNVDGAEVVHLGSSQQLGDGGALIISSAAGKAAVTAAANKDLGGLVQVFGDTGQPVAVITRGARGDGMVQLSDANGEPMVEAGTLPSGQGIVRTGPMERAPGGLMGVPGSFIIGKK